MLFYKSLDQSNQRWLRQSFRYIDIGVSVIIFFEFNFLLLKEIPEITIRSCELDYLLALSLGHWSCLSHRHLPYDRNLGLIELWFE